MNILIVYAYPNDKGYNSAIFKKVKENINKDHDIRILDLYKDKFNPVLYFDENKRRRNLADDPETKKYREDILWSEHIIFIFPIWWSGMPAILKGYIDRVYVKGFAYSYKGIFPVGFLKGKSAWIIITHDTPKLYAKIIQQDYGRVLKKQVLEMSGIKPVRITEMPFLRDKDENKREKFLMKIENMAKEL